VVYLHSQLVLLSLDPCSIPPCHNEPALQYLASLGLSWRDSLLSGGVTVGAGLFYSTDASAAETSRLNYGDALGIESKARLPDRDFVLCF
jgi:hypothetical protein